jgi:hypothetical protein|nr:MAG TPA: hypothetical protein [Caudoviricetes sp.]
MIGIKYDFDVGDVVIGSSGQFETATIDNQCVALLSLSQVCRLTYLYFGAQVGARLVNVPYNRVQPVLSDAQSMAIKDGASNVEVKVSNGTLTFYGDYGND